MMSYWVLLSPATGTLSLRARSHALVHHPTDRPMIAGRSPKGEQGDFHFCDGVFMKKQIPRARAAPTMVSVACTMASHADAPRVGLRCFVPSRPAVLS